MPIAFILRASPHFRIFDQTNIICGVNPTPEAVISIRIT